MSKREALFAIIVAFLVGIIGSLSLRPQSLEKAPIVQHSENNKPMNSVRIKWRVPVAFGTNLPALGDNILYVANQLRGMTGNAIDLQIFEPGELVPPFSITDAIRDGKVEAGYTWLGYDQGKIPSAPLFAAVPFGMEPWEFSAWWYEGGGKKLGQDLYAKQNIHLIYCGITGPETAGWFRDPVRSLKDVKGLKIRFAGIGGKVIQKAGASVTMLPGGEIFQALEKGAIDATEYSLPVVDQLLGFNRVAKFNYYPGWHQPATSLHLAINSDVWNNLVSSDQQLIETACSAGVTNNLARSEALQGAIISQFANIGVSAEILPEEILRELKRITDEVMHLEATADEDFKVILESQKVFRENYSHWKSHAYLPRDF